MNRDAPRGLDDLQRSDLQRDDLERDDLERSDLEHGVPRLAARRGGRR